MSQLPDGWTDDLSITLPPGKTAAGLVKQVVVATLRGQSALEIDRMLQAEFLLSPDDAELARDRTLGGAFRAGTKSPQNRPDQRKDPIAWAAYELALREPEIITRLFPQVAPRTPAETRPAQSQIPVSSSSPMPARLARAICVLCAFAWILLRISDDPQAKIIRSALINVAIAAGVLWLVRESLTVKRFPEFPRGCCWKCGHDRKGLEDRPCPECGDRRA